MQPFDIKDNRAGMGWFSLRDGLGDGYEIMYEVQIAIRTFAIQPLHHLSQRLSFRLVVYSCICIIVGIKLSCGLFEGHGVETFSCDNSSFRP